ncbi:Nucleolar protein 58 [Capsicum annuum]|nr:Nucleolar protein 58 [Capsicum annuum]
MLVLFETPAGFALFKVLDEGKLSKVEDLSKEFTTSDSAGKVVKLKAFSKFENTSEALSAATLLIDSKPSKGLCKFLKSHCDGETLGVADSKLGNAIKEKLQIECVHNNVVMELMRGLRSQLTELISGLATQDFAPMSLGLSHSLSRYKLKFSPDKVDTMIVQAIGLLGDLDKELNTYAMRVREWYGWHFPELAKIVQDNILYAKAVKLMGDRVNAAKLDFSEILTEDVEAELKEAAMISMGTEDEYHCPESYGSGWRTCWSRLIAHGGSLLNLAKQPGSTVQILGAEKALFRALKTKHATPKYGLLYHASLIGQAAPKHKGKIARSLASKVSLAIRYDALGDGQDNTMGLENRIKLEARLRALEGKELSKSAGSAKGKPKIEVYHPSADAILGHDENEEQNISIDGPSQTTEAEKKKEKKKEKPVDAEDNVVSTVDADIGEPKETDTKEKKKKKRDETEENVEVEKSKKKKRKHSDGVDEDESETADKKNEKKKKKTEE